VSAASHCDVPPDAGRTAGQPAVADAPDDRWLARLRWRCRRGLLENDLVLARFLDARGASLSRDELAMLDALLDLTDNDLWELIAGTAQASPALAPLVRQLREA
jgi:antitoxin CptB